MITTGRLNEFKSVVKSPARVAQCSAAIALISLSACSDSAVREQLVRANEPMLREQRWQGVDYYADVYVCSEWVSERRIVSLAMPEGEANKVQLTPEMTDGAQLRLKGRAPKGSGHLYLVVHQVK